MLWFPPRLSKKKKKFSKKLHQRNRLRSCFKASDSNIKSLAPLNSCLFIFNPLEIVKSMNAQLQIIYLGNWSWEIWPLCQQSMSCDFEDWLSYFSLSLTIFSLHLLTSLMFEYNFRANKIGDERTSSVGRSPIKIPPSNNFDLSCASLLNETISLSLSSLSQTSHCIFHTSKFYILLNLKLINHVTNVCVESDHILTRHLFHFFSICIWNKWQFSLHDDNFCFARLFYF